MPAADAFALPIPESVTAEQAVLLTDILPTGYLGAQRADITPGATVAVIGLGPVGVFAVQCAQLFGAARVLAVDMVPDRLARAERLGAEPVDASDGGTVAHVLERTGGRGADAVIEAVGADASISEAIFCCAAGGTVSVIGVSMNLALPLPMPMILFKRLTVRGTLASIPSTWDALIPLIAAGRLTTRRGVHAPPRPVRSSRGLPGVRRPRGRRPQGPPRPHAMSGHELLAGRTVLVTAAAGTGIGFATAKRCLEEGATVVISDAHERRLGEAAEPSWAWSACRATSPTTRRCSGCSRTRLRRPAASTSS